MKILKVFGIVVGIHVFALILIFANPGCSAMTKSPPAPADTAAKSDTTSPTITVPTFAHADPAPAASGFDPNAPAVSYSSAGVHYSPTRPGTPAAGALEAEPVGDVTPASAYTVAKGDSLWSIAKKNHLSKAELAAANNLRPESTLRLGQKLIIPGKSTGGAATPVRSGAAAPSRAAAAEPAPGPRGPADTVKHIVKPGETLGAIARKYQVKVGEVATANNISDPAKIRPGMELIIPGWQTPSAKAAKPGSKGGAKGAAEAAAPAGVPTISVAEPAAAAGDQPAGAAPPVITVEDAPASKKP
jgi:LysM repeat protein